MERKIGRFSVSVKTEERKREILAWRKDDTVPLDITEVHNLFSGIQGVSHINMRYAKHKRMRINGVRIK